MNIEWMKEKAENEGHAILASISSDGSCVIYVNPNADASEVAKSLVVASVEIVKHLESIKA